MAYEPINDAPLSTQRHVAEREAAAQANAPREGIAAVPPIALPRVLRKEGVAAVDGVLSRATASALLMHVNQRLAEAMARLIVDDENLLGAVLCREGRFDLKLDYARDAAVTAGLDEAVRSLGPPLSSLLGGGAELFELGALVSDRGAPRQPLHPDTPWSRRLRVVSTMVALQDVAIDMGPTIYLPRTHDEEARSRLWGVDPADDDEICELLEDSPCLMPLPRTGDAVLFDARTIHCGGANASRTRRVLFYFSFRTRRGGGLTWRGGGFEQPGTLLDSLRGKLRLAPDGSRLVATAASSSKSSNLCACRQVVGLVASPEACFAAAGTAAFLALAALAHLFIWPRFAAALSLGKIVL